MIVYRAYNTVNGKSYVGQTVQTLEKRRKMHWRKQSCRLFKNALLKYGEKSFQWTVLEICSSQGDLNDAERKWVAELDTLAPNGYNLTEGGGAAGKRSEETKAYLREVFSRPEVKKRQSAASSEVQSRPEVKEAHRNVWLGKTRSEEDRRKMSENKLLKKYRWKVDPETGRRVYWSEA